MFCDLSAGSAGNKCGSGRNIEGTCAITAGAHDIDRAFGMHLYHVKSHCADKAFNFFCALAFHA